MVEGPTVLEVAPARVVETAPVQVGVETARQKQVLWFDPNWREFHKLWSIRLSAIVMLLSAAEMAVPAFITCLVIVGAAWVARLMNQRSTNL